MFDFHIQQHKQRIFICKTLCFYHVWFHCKKKGIIWILMTYMGRRGHTFRIYISCVIGNKLAIKLHKTHFLTTHFVWLVSFFRSYLPVREGIVAWERIHNRRRFVVSLYEIPFQIPSLLFDAFSPIPFKSPII